MTPEAIKAVREALAPFAALANRKSESPTDTGKFSLVLVSDLLAARDALALLAAGQAKAPPDRERRDVFDELHIAFLINEWFAPLGFKVEQSHIDGLCEVLHKRLLRLAPVTAGEWQPLETAPKDGTHIIVGQFIAGVPERVTVAHWFDSRLYGAKSGGAGWALSVNADGEHSGHGLDRLTHWTRLPPSPKEAGR